MGFAIDLDVLGSCSLCQIAKDELSIGHGSTPPMMIIRVVKTAPGSVSMAVAPTPPPAPTIKKPDEGSSAKHRKRMRGDAVDDVCAKRRVLGSGSTAGSPLYQMPTNDGGLGCEPYSMKGRASQPPSASPLPRLRLR